MQFLVGFLSKIITDIFGPIIEQFLVKKPAKIVEVQGHLSKIADPVTDESFLEKYSVIKG